MSRRMLIALALLAIPVIAFIALQLAIARDGAAVLAAIDRLAGGERDVAMLEQAQFGEDPAQRLGVWRKRGLHSPMPVMVFIHGGSWSSGNPDSYGFVARNFAERGFLTVIAGYRLYPQVKYPAMLEDAAAAVAWARRNAERLGGDPDRIWIMGHSAGAYNAVSIVLDPRWLETEGVPGRAIAGAIGLAGPYDFHPFDKESTRNSFGDAADPAATQPINHVRRDAPPILLLAGEADTTVKPRNTRALATAIDDAGGTIESDIYSGMDHGDPLVALARPWLDRRPVMERILAFTNDHRHDTQHDAAASSLAVQAKSR